MDVGKPFLFPTTLKLLLRGHHSCDLHAPKAKRALIRFSIINEAKRLVDSWPNREVGKV